MAYTNLASSAETLLRDMSGHVSIEWEIKKFLHLSCKEDALLRSDSFLLSDGEWYIEIYPNGDTRKGSVGWISLFLAKKISSSELEVSYGLGLKKADGSALKSIEHTHSFKEDEGWGQDKFFSRTELLKSTDILTAEGSLVVFCNIRLLDDVSTVMEAASQTLSVYGTNQMCGTDDVDTTPIKCIETLADDLKQLFLSRRESDFTMNVQNKKFEVHRSILSARSPVFRVMLQVDMAEKNSNSVDINDCDPESFENFLMFLYSGNRDNVFSSNALSLYVTAAKYQVDQLKEACSKCLAQNISVESFCDVVTLAMLHDESELLDVATQFFTDYANKIIPTPKWRSFMMEHNALAAELLTKMTEVKYKM